MLRIVLILFVSCFAFSASAHQPEFPEPKNVNDILNVENFNLSRAYYGELVGFPHVFAVDVTERQPLFLEILLPDIEPVEYKPSVIIVRKEKRGVSEVARMLPASGSWVSFREPFGNDKYLRGLSYEEELEPGNYLVEVSTATGYGKYVLVVGKEEKFSIWNYFSLVSDIARVKRFYGKSSFRAIESPLVFVPVLILVSSLWFWHYRRKQKQNA